MPANNCGKVDISGVKCNGDHSKLLCGSGNAYCFATKPVSTSVEEVKGKDDEFGSIDESADTVLYIQDIPVEGSTVKARTFWDEGSSRVLIREKFAEDLGLIKKKKYTLETVGSVEEKQDTCILSMFWICMDSPIESGDTVLKESCHPPFLTCRI